MFLYIAGIIVFFYVFRWFRELGRVPNKSEKFVYITGCDTGFGNLLVKHLDTKGFRVIAGCYTEKGEVELKKGCSDKLTTLHLDVTDNNSIKKAAETIKTQVGEKGKSQKGFQDWSNSALHHRNKLHFRYIQIEHFKYFTILLFLLYFEHINPALVSRRDIITMHLTFKTVMRDLILKVKLKQINLIHLIIIICCHTINGVMHRHIHNMYLQKH